MSQYTSYWLYQKYEKRGDQDWIPAYPNVYSVDGDGTMNLVVKQDDDPACGYTPTGQTQYRWVDLNPNVDYYCEDCPVDPSVKIYRWGKAPVTDYTCNTTTHTKYYKEYYQYSIDGGVSWENVIPIQSRTSEDVIEYNSVDCGYVPTGETIYRWVKTDDTVCSEGEVETRNRTLTTATTCVGYDLHVLEEYQISINGGVTWETTGTSIGVLIEIDSQKCKHVPPTPTPEYENQYFTIVPLENGTVEFLVGQFSSFKYSYDSGNTWLTGTSATTIPMESGQKIMFSGTMLHVLSETGIGRFSSSAMIDVEGNIMSLLCGENFIDEFDLSGASNNIFGGLFARCLNLINAKNLVLPATTLVNGCYRSMFSNCVSLITAPVLPATTLTVECYAWMFENCASLSIAPELPATTLASGCYQSMFIGCTSLTAAPELPATTLANSCYSSMFYGCTSLIKTPSELPGTTLPAQCYFCMFFGCTSLTAAPYVLPATEALYHSCCSMFENCISLSIAPELPATTLGEKCYCGMFEGCVSLTTAPSVLPATALASGCYQSMFEACVSLTKTPTILAETLTASYCCSRMFAGCINLNTITCLATSGTNQNFSTYEWVYDVCNNGTFYRKAGSTWIRGISGIPDGWSSEEMLQGKYYKYYEYKKQYSDDGGITWVDVSPEETVPSGNSIGTYNTLEECEGITPSFHGKLRTIYSGGGTYELECTDSEEVIIYGDTDPYGYDRNAMISAEVGDCVIGIGYQAFIYCENLSSVTMANSVTAITEECFANCTNLSSLEIPGSVISIGSGMCSGCTSLTSIVIPSSVTSIGDRAFRDCSGMTSCTIGSGVTSIGAGVFYGCGSLTNIVIPSSVTSIGNSSFGRCSGLTSCTIGSSVTSIGDNAFDYCTGLTSVSIPVNVTSIGNSAFNRCYSLTSVSIPDSVTSINTYAFNYCTGLTSCTIGSGVRNVGYGILAGCGNLTSITINAVTPPTMESYQGNYYALDASNCPIYVPSQSVNRYKTATGWKNFSSRFQAIT